MKNKNPLIFGVLIAAIFLLLINGLLQSLVLYFANINLEQYSVGITGLSPVYTLSDSFNNYTITLFLLLPVLINILSIEFSFLLLSKSKVGMFRKTAITFILLIVGYIIVFVFYGLINLVLSPSNTFLWSRLITLWQLEGNQNFVFIFFIIVLLFSYLQITQKRLMQYLVISKAK